MPLSHLSRGIPRSLRSVPLPGLAEMAALTSELLRPAAASASISAAERRSGRVTGPAPGGGSEVDGEDEVELELELENGPPLMVERRCLDSFTIFCPRSTGGRVGG